MSSYRPGQFVVMLQHTEEGELVPNGRVCLCRYVGDDPDDDSRIIIEILDPDYNAISGTRGSISRKFTSGWEA